MASHTGWGQPRLLHPPWSTFTAVFNVSASPGKPPVISASPGTVEENRAEQHTEEEREQRCSSRAMGFFLLWVFLYQLFSSHPVLCAGRDRLAPGQSISVNQTLVSSREVFALGFFSPQNSTTTTTGRPYYAGIWYHGLPVRTVVWVANREAPLRDSSGRLTIAGDGNLAVVDSRGNTLWSTGVPGVPSASAAVLLDSGNLVLRDGVGDDLWQSFDHPTDTLLPGMNIRNSFSGRERTRVAAWRTANDPAPGEFALTVSPDSPFQAYVMRGSEIYWRGKPWAGSPAAVFTLWLGNKSSVYVETVFLDAKEFTWMYTVTQGTLLARYTLDPSGSYAFSFWNESRWTSTGAMPRDNCDLYNWCGANAACVRGGGSPSCRCLAGFQPRTGGRGAGCERVEPPPQCGGGGGGGGRFETVAGMRLPDGFTFVTNRTAAQCAAECEATCRCGAYAAVSSSNSSGGSSLVGARCFMWLGELLDLAEDATSAEDFYVRFPISQQDNNYLLGSSSKGSNDLLKIILPIVAVGMLLMGICCYSFRKIVRSKVSKRMARKALMLEDLNFSDVPGSEKDVSEVPFLDFRSVKAATSNFSSLNQLGQGGFGPVYKGKLLNGHEVAVKRLSKSSVQGYQEFANEVKLIAKLQHKNLVRLLGWCTHKDEKILIYEYMPNSSLDKFIFYPARSAELNWEKRFKIIEGIANGLLYLHQYSRLRIIHRDLKTSNILLDGGMNPKISDFGLARIFEINQTEANTRKVAGTYGYMSPEYASDGLFSEKSDVFSFGVILLEIITGKRSTGFYAYRNTLNLLGYAWQMWEEGNGLELWDPSTGNSFSATELLKCIQLGLLCIQEDAADRPTMSSIVSMLSNENSTLPMPKKPAFAIRGHPNLIVGISMNELTASLVEGR